MIKFEFSFDDGDYGNLRIAELLGKYGFDNCTFYIPLNWRTLCSEKNVAPLKENNIVDLSKLFRIGAHTVSHSHLTRMRFEAAQVEIEKSKIPLEKLTGKKIDHFCYPRGYANAKLKKEVAKHYAVARNTLVGNLDPPKNPVWQTPTVHIAGMTRPEYEGTTWLEEARKLLKKAKRKKYAIYHCWGHSWEISKYGEWANFETLLKELKDAKDEQDKVAKV